ncbi:unnamed protein product [Aureobasidium vineae]|uniref:F-box domain-containing protein n=1 Tax=Aureobasidium vineae TaxID=2773715 RepID=A0A9N8JR49_9PEZI|nr:unnamed protein product [Aureobasidium vineae]
MDSSPPASFSSLPPELVSKICSDPGLDKKDLIVLRLTSKAQGIHASATRAFGRHCFSRVPLLYTEYSLETFLKICRHPVFRSCIRLVELSCFRFDPGHFNLLVESMTIWNLDWDELVRNVQLLSARCDAQESLEPWDAKTLLERAFARFAESGHSLTIAVSTDEYNALGVSRVFEPEPETNYFHADVPFALHLLLASAKRAGCRVPKLDITVASRLFSSQDYDCDLSDLMHSNTELSLEMCFITDFDEDEHAESIR